MSEGWAGSAWGRGDDGEQRHEAWRYSLQSEGEGTTPSEGGGAPDCVGRLLGVRCFILRYIGTLPSEHRQDRLYSLFFKHTWTPGKDERAECLYHRKTNFDGRLEPRKHASPYGECECGLYAYYSYWDTWWQAYRGDISDRIFAVVGGWGDIEEHKEGFRSEYMRIEALVGPSPFTVRRRRARKMIERFAEIYEVPIVWSPWRVHRWMEEFADGVRLKDQ